MSAPSPGSGLDFRIRLPEHWYDFSVADEEEENTIADLVRQRCTAAGLDTGVASRFTESARRSVRTARQNGALHAGGTFEVHEDGLLTVSVVVAAVTPPGDGDVLGALVAVDDVAAAAGGTWHRTGTVQLPQAGRAGRVHGVQDVTFEGATVRTAFMHTVVPLPGSAQVLVVTGTSPNLAEADDVFDLLARITGTLQLSAR